MAAEGGTLFMRLHGLTGRTPYFCGAEGKNAIFVADDALFVRLKFYLRNYGGYGGRSRYPKMKLAIQK